MAAKSIAILGATGSIGQSTADIILSAPERFNVDVITAHENVEALAEMAVRLKAQRAVIANPDKEEALRLRLEGSGVEVSSNIPEAVRPSTDLTIAAIMGMAGLRPLLNAIENSKAVAIANKEPLVAAGDIVLSTARGHGCQILPIDSEHNAIFQVFEERQRAAIEKIILTASGGPFRTWEAAQIASASPAQALKHPNWEMGRKISIDSASMMNKALEIIEAHYLFAMPADKIDVLIHPQSVVHSMVEYADGSVLAQMGASDMRTPIAYALGWPERIATPGERLDLKSMNRLDFEEPDMEKFPALGLAYACLKRGQSACVAMNAANEIAVEAFLNHRISFPDIMNVIDTVLNNIEDIPLAGLDQIEHLDHISRVDAETAVESMSGSAAESIHSA